MSAPIRLGSITAGTAAATYVSGGGSFADVFSSDLVPKHDCVIRMTVAVDAAVSIFRRETSNNIDIGSGIPFVANVEETFIFDMEKGVPFNIRLDGDCEILKMTVFEIDEGVV